jgi:hypothetical protein
VNLTTLPDPLHTQVPMHLLQAGVDVNSIALWLGHVNPSTTHAYVEADLAMKERTLSKLAPPSTRSFRFLADDRLLAFLSACRASNSTRNHHQPSQHSDVLLRRRQTGGG